MGFAFLGFLDYAGPVQSALRQWLGAGFRLPDLRSYWGVVAMMALAFYPYVYLLARAAFAEQGASAIETARTLGRSRWAAFVHVTIPMARPSLAAGVALAMMEALADFGTVAVFGYRTLTEAIYRVWYGMFDRHRRDPARERLLLLFALGLILLERRSRGRARFTQSARRGARDQPGAAPRMAGRRGHAWPAPPCSGWPSLCPSASSRGGPPARWPTGRLRPTSPRSSEGRARSPRTTAIAACSLAVVLGYAGRLHPTPAVRVSTQLASMGYALPGAMIAVGVLLPLAWLDHRIGPRGRARRRACPWGMLLTGSAFGLILAYVVRFLAVALQTVEASLTKISPSLDDAARSLGTRTAAALRRVHLPMIRGGIFTAFVLVFVETMKEMPATLLLRPFGLNTLAVDIWERTSEAMWREAAVPALSWWPSACSPSSSWFAGARAAEPPSADPAAPGGGQRKGDDVEDARLGGPPASRSEGPRTTAATSARGPPKRSRMQYTVSAPRK